MTTNVFFAGKTILLVEDELAVAEIVAMQLTALGFDEILISTTLRQAEETLERHAIDAALLDIKLLRGENTIQLGRSLSADGVPIVFYSGFNAEEMSRATRGHEFMEKPISLPRLKAALQRAILRAPALTHLSEHKKMAGQEARQ